jgi:hypothetical protein
MTKLIEIDTSAHWYDISGDFPKSAHDADLRVARKQNLYTSPSSIERDIWKNSFLDNWKLQQYALAAADHPRQMHESREGYAERIYEHSMEKAKSAAAFGKKFHAGVEKLPMMPGDEMDGWLMEFLTWYSVNVKACLKTEFILVDHDLGVAGTCDFLGYGSGQFEGKIIMPDWKTQDVKLTKAGKPAPVFYKSWKRQLAFYAVAYAKSHGGFPAELPVCISVVIDSNTPRPPFVKVWDKADVLAAYKQFVIGAYLWFHDKKYWPQRHGQFDIKPSVPMPYDSTSDNNQGSDNDAQGVGD